MGLTVPLCWCFVCFQIPIWYKKEKKRTCSQGVTNGCSDFIPQLMEQNCLSLMCQCTKISISWMSCHREALDAITKTSLWVFFFLPLDSELPPGNFNFPDQIQRDKQTSNGEELPSGPLWFLLDFSCGKNSQRIQFTSALQQSDSCFYLSLCKLNLGPVPRCNNRDIRSKRS